MLAAEILERLTACGVRLKRDADALVASPRAALTDELRKLIREHKPELLEALAKRPEAAGLKLSNGPAVPMYPAMVRKARALAYLEQHPEAARACFADLKADPEHVIFTVAVREPWGAVEALVARSRFDALALIELSLRYPSTAVSVPVH